MNESASLLIGTPSKKPLPETSAGSIMYYNTIENVGLPPGRGRERMSAAAYVSGKKER